ncbi:MAG: putative metalloprotease CJM1_0395 family protein [Candidatus Sumerlaeota bacterium]|nr:putative metalloprotease CJM1_0395 family protein [Candidatus Sumerlaeota bacterium]
MDTAQVSNRGRELGTAHQQNGKSKSGDKKTTDGLTPEQERQLASLKKRDAEVRAHEQAHVSAGGQYAGAIHLEYTQGPDNQIYATGGEVSIDTSPVSGNAQATIAKMQVIEQAALAPAQPSGQDQSVYAAAVQTAQEAQAELSQEQLQKIQQAITGTSSNAARNSKQALTAYRKNTPSAGAMSQV